MSNWNKEPANKVPIKKAMMIFFMKLKGMIRLNSQYPISQGKQFEFF